MNLPLSKFEEWRDKLSGEGAILDAEKDTVVMCHHGMRWGGSLDACAGHRPIISAAWLTSSSLLDSQKPVFSVRTLQRDQVFVDFSQYSFSGMLVSCFH